jgi:hypothetical protein
MPRTTRRTTRCDDKSAKTVGVRGNATTTSDVNNENSKENE